MTAAHPAEVERPPNEPLHCMEVWGGNGTTEQQLARPGLDLWIWSRCRDGGSAGGGDLHLLSSCASGRITRMLLADVCGDGPVFHEIARDLRALMKKNVNTVRHTRLVDEMSHRLVTASQRGGFASMLVSTYFAPSRSLAVCNAGQPPPLLFRVRTREWSVLKQSIVSSGQTQAPLGVVDHVEYQQFSTQLEVGDMVLCYSSLLTECRGADGGMLGLEGLLARVRNHTHRPPAQMVGELVAGIQGENRDNLTTEDATVLLCRATNRGVGWQDNLLAPFRLLRPVSDVTNIE